MTDLDIRGDVDRAAQTLADAEARAQRLRYQPGAAALLTDPANAMLLGPTVAMFTAARQLVSAAHRLIGLNVTDVDGWEQTVDEIAAGLGGVIALQSLWQTIGGQE